MNTVLKTNNLTKRYGRIVAVDNLNLQIPQGSIYGILGPNGSGKTTTLGMALSVIRPTSGDFQWFGKPGTPEVRKRVGAILEGPLFYPYLSGEANLKIVADIKGVPHKRIQEVLETVGLLERAGSPFKTYSLGMKQRLALAGALLADPEVLILDEPTNGLDPEGIAEMRNLIREIGKGETTVLLASHLLDEVEKVCDHVAVLRKGQLLYSGRVDLMTSSKPLVELGAVDRVLLEQTLKTMPGFESFDFDGEILLAQFGQNPDPAAINKVLGEKGIHLSHLALRKTTLESQFLELIRTPQP